MQVSAGSHTPAEARQLVPALLKTLAGHAPDVPLQVSWTSQTPETLRHTVPEERSWQVLLQHEPEVPFNAPSSHCSPFALSIVELPHSDSSEMLTKCPSLFWFRLPWPG